MLKKVSVALCVLTLSLGAVACQRLEQPESSKPAKFMSAIPLDHGDLISVTLHPDQPRLAALWFQKPDKTISVVRVNIAEGKIYEDVITIARK